MTKIGGKLLTATEIAEKNITLSGSVIFEIKKSEFKGLI